jgi:hypothetical protein
MKLRLDKNTPRVQYQEESGMVIHGNGHINKQAHLGAEPFLFVIIRL